MEGYVEYQRREYCKDIKCPMQALLDDREDGSPESEEVRGMCKNLCIHTTYQFHHWLIEKGYLVVRPAR